MRQHPPYLFPVVDVGVVGDRQLQYIRLHEVKADVELRRGVLELIGTDLKPCQPFFCPDVVQLSLVLKDHQNIEQSGAAGIPDQVQFAYQGVEGIALVLIGAQ